MDYLIVENIFEIKDRGFILAGHYNDYKGNIKVGEDIEIENPDGTIFRTKLTGVEHICFRSIENQKKHPFGLLVRKDTCGKIQKGAKIKSGKVAQ